MCGVVVYVIVPVCLFDWACVVVFVVVVDVVRCVFVFVYLLCCVVAYVVVCFCLLERVVMFRCC